MKNNIEMLLINFLNWLEQKTYKRYGGWESKYLFLKRDIKNQLYNLKIFVNIFKLPKVLRSYNYTLHHALEGLKYSREEVESRNSTIEYLLEKLVEEKLGGEDADYTKEQEREAYREVYLDDAISEIVYDGNMPVFELPSKYQTEDEQDDAFDRSYEHQRCAMAHCYDDYEDQIECEFRYGPLVKGGWYDKKQQ